MRSQMTIYAQFSVFISLLLIGACVHKPETFSMDIVHNDEEVYFEQSVFSKGSAPVTLGHPEWGHSPGYQFKFEIDNISNIYYGYLSIVSWDVEVPHHKIFLNGAHIDYVPISKVVHWGPTLGGHKNIPRYLGDTQIYLPSKFFKQGLNTFEIEPVIKPDKWKTDTFTIKDLDVVIVKTEKTSSKIDTNKKLGKQRYFPKKLSFFSVLTDEELYISTVHLPKIFNELNFQFGVHKKKLSYIYSKIGDYYRWKGDYAKNLLYQKKAVETELKDGYTSLLPYLRAHLALSYHYVGNYAQSIEECKSALDDLSKVNKEKLTKISPTQRENPDLLKLLINSYIALNYYHLNNYKLAEAYCSKIDRGFPLALAIKFQILGNIASNRKNHDDAERFFSRAVFCLITDEEIYHDIINNNKLLFAREQFLKENHNSAIETLKDIKDPTHEFKWRSNLLLGKIHYAKDEINQAINLYLKSIDEIEYSRARLNSYGFKISFMNDKQQPYREVISSLVQVDRRQEAFKYVEKSKARAFIDLMASGKNKAYRKNAKLKDLSREEIRLREKLIDLQGRLDNEKKMFKNRGVNEETKNRLESTRKALDEFYAKKASQNMEFESLTAAKTLSALELIEILPDDISLIEYYYDDKHLYAWVIAKKGSKCIKKEIEKSELENLIKTYRVNLIENRTVRGLDIKNYQKTKISSEQTLFEGVNDRLAEILVGGIFDWVATEKVYLVPHGMMHYLPFQSLIQDSKYLIQKYQIGYLPSATAFKYVLAKRKKKSYKILALGNPELQSKEMHLPYAEKEVQQIKKIHNDAYILIGKAASEAAFKKHSMDYDIIHVASHGEFNLDTPLLSCLRLAPGEGEDGRLETREIFGHNLNAYLVVLSACDTALGKLTKGDEVIGLTRAFIFAGTPSILGTIWSVNDRSTSILMVNFYHNIKIMNKLKALQQAQIAMIQSKEYSSPYYWAGFQMIGDYY